MSEDKVKYSLCVIARNCPENLDKLLTSYGKYPDEIVVVNTGIDAKEDGFKETDEVAKKYGAKVYHRPWTHDFSDARNFSFEKASHPWVLWLDTDDVVENPGEVDANARFAMSTNSVNCLLLEYLYEFDDNGNCTLILDRERFVKKADFEWRAPIHEVLCAKVKLNGTKLPPEIGRVVHTRKTSDTHARMASLRRNLKVFKEQFEKKKKDPGLRMLFYWGNTLLGLGDYPGAVEKYQEYMRRSEEENSPSKAEQYVALWTCSEAYRQQQKFKEAFDWAARAVILMPHWPTAYMHAGQALVGMNELDKAITYANIAKLYSKSAKEEMVSSPKAIQGIPDLTIAQALCIKGEWQKALPHLEIASKFYADSPEFEEISKWVLSMKEHHEDKEAFKRIVDKMWSEKKFKAVHTLALNAPGNLRDTKEVAELLPKRRPVNKRSIAFFCPETLQGFTWGPWSISGGVGGSEEAVINAAREFAKAGWHVEVYTSTGKSRSESPVIADGVEYWPLHCWTGKYDNKLDVIVWWRAPVAAEVVEHNSALNIAWMHDIFVEHAWKPSYLDNYDAVMLLSKYHRELYGIVPDDKVLLTENGLDPNLFVPLDQLKNNPHRMIWGSDPSRGLQYILPHWSRIREAVPDAELHVYYGWSPHFINTSKVSKEHKELFDFVEANKGQPGIFWHGRVGQDELAHAYAESGIWGYPTTFPEIHCITALKAQAHGCTPITVDDFALSETVRFGHKLPGPMSEDRHIKTWVECVINAMQHPWTREQRLEMAKWARTHTWEAVVREWSERFEKLLESKLQGKTLSPTLTLVS